MVMQCPACGHQQPVDGIKCCCECGARLGGNGQKAQAEGGELLIKPLGGPTDPSGLAYCTKHSGEKVVSYCGRCQDLACVVCLTHKPKQHETCSDVLSLQKFLALSDPFKDQKRRLAEAHQTHQALLQKVQSATNVAEKTYDDEVVALQDVEDRVLGTLEENYEAAVAELKAAKESQRRLVLQETKRNKKDLDLNIKGQRDDFTRSIGDITIRVQQLSTAQQQLSAPFSATNMVTQVTANKDGTALLSTDLKAPTTVNQTRAVTSGYTDSLKRLAELRVAIETGKMEPSRDVTSGVGAAANPPQHEAQTAVPTVPLTGPGSQKFFIQGTRVVRGPDWPSGWTVDAGQPGTVEQVPTDGVVVVRWDAFDESLCRYRVGRDGVYHLSLLHPPAPQ